MVHNHSNGNDLHTNNKTRFEPEKNSKSEMVMVMVMNLIVHFLLTYSNALYKQGIYG